MEEHIVTKTQKGEGVQVQNQGDADRFFLCPKKCPRRILATRPNYYSACPQKHLATSDALSEGEKKRTVGNGVMAASL